METPISCPLRVRFPTTLAGDDIMISYAADGGGVAPTSTSAVMFLVQGLDRRRWRISTDPAAPKVSRDDVELKLLWRSNPTRLAARTRRRAVPAARRAHDSVAVGPCMTLSLGMRKPSTWQNCCWTSPSTWPSRWASSYVDPDLEPAGRPRGNRCRGAAARGQGTARAARALDDAGLRQWFGGFITRYRGARQRGRGGARSPGELERLLAARRPCCATLVARPGRAPAAMPDLIRVGSRAGGWGCRLRSACALPDRSPCPAPWRGRAQVLRAGEPGPLRPAARRLSRRAAAAAATRYPVRACCPGAHPPIMARMLIPTDFTLEPATWEHDGTSSACALRYSSSRQAIPRARWDELDLRSWHVLARALDGTPIGTGRLAPEHKIGRMAVLRDWRGKGVGKAIVRALVGTRPRAGASPS